MRRVSIIASVILLSACASQPARYPTYTSPSVVQAEPEDDSSGFSTEADDQRADEAIASAQRTYGDVQVAASAFSISKSKCQDRSMESALSSLQSVDEVAQRYLQMATTSSIPADREAAMDVLDELNNVILDGIMDVTKAYRSHGCFPYARHILTQAKSIYAGSAYASWVGAMDTEMAAIISEQVATPTVTTPSPPATPAPKKKNVKKKLPAS